MKSYPQVVVTILMCEWKGDCLSASPVSEVCSLRCRISVCCVLASVARGRLASRLRASPAGAVGNVVRLVSSAS